MMNIIFLDVDGVLNSSEYMKFLNGTFNSVEKYLQLDPAAVARLNRITNATGASIVVSSAWRIHYKYMSDLRGTFIKAGVTGKIIDKTPVNNNIRGEQIAEWLKKYRRPINKFIILDDSSDMGSLMNCLIKTSQVDGLQDQHVELAISMLNDKY